MLLLWLGVAWWQPDPQLGEESKKLSSNAFFAQMTPENPFIGGCFQRSWGNRDDGSVHCLSDQGGVCFVKYVLMMYMYIWNMCIYKHVRFMLRCFLHSFVDLWGGVRVWVGTLNTVTLLDRSGREVWSQTQVSFVFHNCPSFSEQLNCVSRRAWFAWWTPLANTSIHIWKSQTPRNRKMNEHEQHSFKKLLSYLNLESALHFINPSLYHIKSVHGACSPYLSATGPTVEECSRQCSNLPLRMSSVTGGFLWCKYIQRAKTFDFLPVSGWLSHLP